jgi:hypothetical protein
MGLYAVRPGQEKVVFATMVAQIKSLPELRKLSQKARKSLRVID